MFPTPSLICHKKNLTPDQNMRIRGTSKNVLFIQSQVCLMQISAFGKNRIGHFHFFGPYISNIEHWRRKWEIIIYDLWCIYLCFNKILYSEMFTRKKTRLKIHINYSLYVKAPFMIANCTESDLHLNLRFQFQNILLIKFFQKKKLYLASSNVVQWHFFLCQF